MDLKIALMSADVGESAEAGYEDYAQLLQLQVEGALSDAADVILLPEYLWGVWGERKCSGIIDYKESSDVLWQTVINPLVDALKGRKALIVLGTAPFFDPESKQLYNRAIVINDDEVLYQDKLHLTPWENAFSAGECLLDFTFRGVRCAVPICLDIEIPELSVLLKKRRTELLLVPSATETLLGSERIHRCASARAVELCAYVAVAPLLGYCDVALLSENVGRTALYSPSQDVFSSTDRMNVSVYRTANTCRDDSIISMTLLRQARANCEETNPFRNKFSG